MSRASNTFSDHLRELRLRLLVSFLFFVAGGVLAYFLNVPLLQALQHSFRQTLYYTTPAGAFNLAMKISLIGGIVFALPALIYNVAAFIQPALEKRFTKSELRIMTVMTVVLSVVGAAFAYYLVVPMSLNFFQKFDVKGFQTLISATEYVNFVTNCILIFVVLFQLPLLLLFIDRVRPLPPRRLWKLEKFVVVGSLVIALILPFTYDPLTQFLIALPIILLYNLSILLIAMSHRAQHRRVRKVHAKTRTQPRAQEEMLQPVSPRPVAPNAVQVAVTTRARPVAAAPRCVDGFAPRATAQPLAPARSGQSSQRVISDFVGQPIRRTIQYQSRRTIDVVLPNRSGISGVAPSRPFPQPSAE